MNESEATPPQSFGSSESLIVAVPRFVPAMIERCRKVASLPTPFGSYLPVCERMDLGYPLFLVARRDDKRLAQICEFPEVQTPDRKKKASSKFPALLITCLVCRPQSEDERKHCSNWSVLYKCAEAHGILPEDFLSWAKGTSVSEARRALRGPKAATMKKSPSVISCEVASDNYNPASKGIHLTVPFLQGSLPALANVLAGSHETSAWNACISGLRESLSQLNDFLDSNYEIPKVLKFEGSGRAPP